MASASMAQVIEVPAAKLRVQAMPGGETTAALSELLPAEPNTVRGTGPWTLWLGPKEWLIYSVGGAVEALTDALITIVQPLMQAGSHVSADVSSGLTLLEISGSQAIDILATGCGLDLAGGAVPAGHCAQSHFGHVSITIHRPDGSDTLRLFADRSVARYLRDSLCLAHEVRHLRPR
jgi:sarcosine oxidase, subunit gamma